MRQVNCNAHPELTCGTLWDECHMCTTCGTVREGSWNNVGQQPPIIRKPTTKYWLFSVTFKSEIQSLPVWPAIRPASGDSESQ